MLDSVVSQRMGFGMGYFVEALRTLERGTMEKSRDGNAASLLFSCGAFGRER